MSNKVVSLEDARRSKSEAERFLHEAENTLRESGLVRFDQALKILFLAGHADIAFEAMRSPAEIKRSIIRVCLRKALVLLEKRRLSYRWEEEWNYLCLSTAFAEIDNTEDRI